MKLYKDYVKIKFNNKIVKLDTGINMAYYEFGENNDMPLMLIHGVTDGCVTWTQLIPGLVELGYHLYIVEYRGNGMTDKPEADANGYTAELIAEDVINLMDKIGLQKTNVAGHSYGSLISQVLCAKYPEKFTSCILMATGIDCQGDLIKLAKEGDGKFLGMYEYKDYLPEEFCEEWMATSNEDPDFCQAVAMHLKQMPIAAYRNLIIGLEHFNGREWLPYIAGPISVVWGTDDDIFDEKQQKSVVKELRNAKVNWVEVSGASHNAFWDSENMAKKYINIIDECVKWSLGQF